MSKERRQFSLDFKIEIVQAYESGISAAVKSRPRQQGKLSLDSRLL